MCYRYTKRECLHLWVEFRHVLAKHLVIRLEPELSFVLCYLIYVCTKTRKRTEKVSLHFFVGAITLIARVVLRHIDVHTDGVQSYVGTAALITVDNLHHKVVLTEGFEPTFNCLGNSAQFQFGVVSKRPAGVGPADKRVVSSYRDDCDELLARR